MIFNLQHIKACIDTSHCHSKHIVYILFLWAALTGHLQGDDATDVRLEADPIFDAQVFVRETGDPDKESLVLIHGLGTAASTDWDKTIAALKNQYHIITLDLPGFGRSDKGNKNYTPTKYAALIRYITSRYSKQPFHLVGHSMGGAIALRYASKYPEDVRSLTLVDVAGVLHRLAYTSFLAPMGLDMLAGYSIPGHSAISNGVASILGKIERNISFDLRHLVDNPFLREKISLSNPAIVSALGLVMEDFSEAPGQVMAPTLIIWGGRDKIAPIRTGFVLNSLISGSELRIIRGAGHVPIKNNFDEFIKYLQAHLQGQLRTTPERDSRLAYYREEVVCNKQSNQTYTGHIGKLVISRCKQVLIKNAYITQLVVNGSHVDILNSHITSQNTALISRKSTITVTSGEITGKIAIEATGGRFDIAGTLIKGKKAAIQAIKRTNFIFSLATIDSPVTGRAVKIHGLRQVTPGQPL